MNSLGLASASPQRGAKRMALRSAKRSGSASSGAVRKAVSCESMDSINKRNEILY